MPVIYHCELGQNPSRLYHDFITFNSVVVDAFSDKRYVNGHRGW